VLKIKSKQLSERIKTYNPLGELYALPWEIEVLTQVYLDNYHLYNRGSRQQIHNILKRHHTKTPTTLSS